MNRHLYGTELERFVLSMRMLLLVLLAGLVVVNSLNEKCEGGWRLLSLPCHSDDDYEHGS